MEEPLLSLYLRAVGRTTRIINGKEEAIFIPTVGKHNIYNAMAAILVGLTLGMKLEDIKLGFNRGDNNEVFYYKEKNGKEISRRIGIFAD